MSSDRSGGLSGVTLLNWYQLRGEVRLLYIRKCVTNVISEQEFLFFYGDTNIS